MIRSSYFYDILKENNINFFTGVPDSLLKSFCAYITDHTPEKNHIIAANEGTAIGIATGYHLATGNIPLVYMQNSGIGNATNPLLSLASEDVYSIPILLVIGWRGEPEIKDEPQHKCQGRITEALLKTMEIPYIILSNNEADINAQIQKIIEDIKNTNKSHAILICKGTFDKYDLKNKIIEERIELNREDAIKILIDNIDKDDIIVSTTGMTSRELFEYRKSIGDTHDKDFLTVGSMGHASQIALGIALNTNKKVWCFDGDGAVLMHFGGLTTIGAQKPKNLIHIVFNNESHESVGGQPTVAGNINLKEITLRCGYSSPFKIQYKDELIDVIEKIYSKNIKFPVFIDIKVKTGHRNDLGRPTISPVENKKAFMENLQK